MRYIYLYKNLDYNFYYLIKTALQGDSLTSALKDLIYCHNGTLGLVIRVAYYDNYMSPENAELFAHRYIKTCDFFEVGGL